MNPINLECPRCGGGIPSDDRLGQYPGAASRWDSAIEICSKCGQEEAMLQFAAMTAGGKEHDVVHPVFGEKLWVHVPKWA